MSKQPTESRQAGRGSRDLACFFSRLASFFSLGVFAAAVLLLLPPLSLLAMSSPSGLPRAAIVGVACRGRRDTTRSSDTLPTIAVYF